MRGYSLGFKLPNQGLDWRGGTFAAQFEGSRLEVTDFNLPAGDGKVRVSGWVGANTSKGQGVDARLTGRIALNATETGLPVARGEVRVAEGSYELPPCFTQRIRVGAWLLFWQASRDRR